MTDRTVMILASALAAAALAGPAAAQRAVETAPVPVPGAYGAAGAAAVSAGLAPGVAPAPGLGLTAPAGLVAAPVIGLAPSGLVAPAALPVAIPAAAPAETAVSPAQALAAPAAPAAAATPSILRTAGTERRGSPAVVTEHSRRIAPAIPEAPALERMGTGSAYEAGVRLEDAVTGAPSRASDGAERPVAGAWSALRASGLSRSARGVVAYETLPAVASRSPMAAARRAAAGLALSNPGALLALAGVAALVVLSLATGLAQTAAILSSLGLLALTGSVAGNSKPQRPAEVSAELQAKVEAAAQVAAKIDAEVGKVIVGQKEMVRAIKLALIAREHVLLEGVPGVAKTQTVKAVADATEGQFQRIQGTPDKLPSDILGAEILEEDANTGAKAMRLERGPVFTNILLVDEINRMMPKTQAALLEAMQERRVTIGRTTLELPQPFILLATQNPIEQEGTYRLPEAQQDRFMLKVIVPRPRVGELKEIMNRFASHDKTPQASKVTTLEEMVAIGRVADEVYVSGQLQEAIANIVEATNDPAAYGLDLKGSIENGASPRAAIYLMKAARVNALLEGRSWVERSDIFAVAWMVLRHRLILSYQALAGGVTPEDVIEKVLTSRAMWLDGPLTKPADRVVRGKRVD